MQSFWSHGVQLVMRWGYISFSKEPKHKERISQEELLISTLFTDNLCWRVYWSWGSSLAHETFLLLWVRDYFGRTEVHHEGWPTFLLWMLWVTVCRVLRGLWGEYWWVTSVTTELVWQGCLFLLLAGHLLAEFRSNRVQYTCEKLSRTWLAGLGWFN